MRDAADGARRAARRHDRDRGPDRRIEPRPQRRRQPAGDSERGRARGDDRPAERLEAGARGDRPAAPAAASAWSTATTSGCCAPSSTRSSTSSSPGKSDRKNYARPALRLVQAIFSQFLHLPIVGREGAVPADLDKAWDDLVARLEQGPAFIVAGQKLVTQPGRLQGTVGAQQLAGVPDFFRRRPERGRGRADGRTAGGPGPLRGGPRCGARDHRRDPRRARRPGRVVAGEPCDRQGGLRADAARGAAAALRCRRDRAHGARRAGARLGRGGVADGAVEEAQAALRPGERRRPGARRPGAGRLLPRPDRRAHGLHEGARGRHRAGVAGLDADRRDAGVPAAGLARRLDVFAAPVREVEHRLLLHHAAALARGGGEAARHERGLRPRPDLVDGGARGDARATSCSSRSPGAIPT